MRLDKFMTSQNICSRKAASKLAKSGTITVNGKPAAKCDMKVDPERDIIEVGGKRIEYREFVYIMMNKPSGVLSASTDKKAKAVSDLLPDELRRRGLFPAGRLDKDTTGLLIITDDGGFAHKMLSPKSGVYKLYRAALDKPLSDEGKAKLERGVVLESGESFRPARVRFPGESDRTDVLVEITEGRFHEVKRMFASCGCEVEKLRRLAVGELFLDEKISEGEARLISSEELKRVFSGQNS